MLSTLIASEDFYLLFGHIKLKTVKALKPISSHLIRTTISLYKAQFYNIVTLHFASKRTKLNSTWRDCALCILICKYKGMKVTKIIKIIIYEGDIAMTSQLILCSDIEKFLTIDMENTCI